MYFARDFHADALIGSGKGGLPLRRGVAEDEDGSAKDENFSQGAKHSIMISHRGPQVIVLSDPKSLRRAIWSAFAIKPCKPCAIRVITKHADSK